MRKLLILVILVVSFVATAGRSILAAHVRSMRPVSGAAKPTGSLPATEIETPSVLPGRPYVEIAEQIRRLASEYPDDVTILEIARSRQGRAVQGLRIALSGPSPADERPAILIVGGLDPTYARTSDIVLGVAEQALNPAPEAEPDLETTSTGNERPTTTTRPVDLAERLTEFTLYVIPRVNVDGTERFLTDPREDNERTTTPTDDDRDGVADDDGPEDLNGDGLITQLRVRDIEGTLMADPDEPRLLRPADSAKGERGVYKVYTEGVDNDDDGAYNEDGNGGTDLNRNFPHAWPERHSDAGITTLCEPESRGLAEFVVAHPMIAAVIVYGRHDNVVHVADSQSRDVSGRGYLHMHPDDAALYENISEKFKKLTGLEDSPKADDAGSFFVWMYAERGLPTFATTGWWRPKPPEPTTSQPADGATTQPADATTQPADEESPPSEDVAPAKRRGRRGDTRRGRPGRGGGPRSADASQPPDGPRNQSRGSDRAAVESAPPEGRGPSAFGGPRAAPPGRGRGRRGGGREGERGPGGGPAGAAEPGRKDSAIDESDRAWLKYSDTARDKSGFIEWTAFEHPHLGSVEIGGFVPGFRENPPASALPEIIEKQAAFVADIAGRLPQVRVAACRVTARADSVYEVELALVNDGEFPTALAMARLAQVADPFVLRLDLPAEDILGGQRVFKIPSLGGMGGTAKVRWIIRGAGHDVTLQVYSRQHGTFDYSFTLTPTPTSLPTSSPSEGGAP